MPILMGPALSFRGCDGENWNLTAVVVSKDNPGELTANGKSAQPVALWEQKTGTAFRYSFAFPMGAKPGTGSYTVDGTTYDVAIPAIDQAPRMAYASCNGFSSLKLMKQVDDNNYLWTTMARKHGLKPAPGAPPQEKDGPEVKKSDPYHLLLLGGDQVYADEMWETVGVMKDWAAKSWKDGNKATASDSMRKALDAFYFDLYRKRWSQPEVAQMMARVPAIAMWDDHDLTDGWGSYPVERQNCEVYGAIWNSAVKAFVVFQQHLKDDERRPGTIGKADDPDWWKQTATAAKPTENRVGAFSFAYRIGSVMVLAIDMRSQRTSETQVVGDAHWEEIYDWMKTQIPKDVLHLLVMSSIPVVYPGFDTLESLLGFIPGHQDLEDDLRDHWNSKPHKGERVRLVHNLLELPKRNIRATLLSGDVHVAALGIVESTRADQTKDDSDAVVNQLISSGIVHPGPGGVVVFALQHLFDSEDEIDRGIIGRMIQFPGSQAKFVGSRNYLSIEPDDKNQLWCNWLAEKERFPYTKVIHTV
jgi:hypothetical protein